MTTGIVDAHVHLWDPAARDHPWMADVPTLRRVFGLRDLDQARLGTDVRSAVVVQAAHDPGETDALLALGRPVDAVVGWFDLTAPDPAGRLTSVIAAGRGRLVGLRHQAHDEPDAGWLARPEVVAGVASAAAAGLAFDLLVRAREHVAAMSLVDAVPSATFVLDHAGKPAIGDDSPTSAAAWRARMREFASRPHVVCKISGLLTEAGSAWRHRPVDRYLREVVEIFGPSRTVFGTDWPVSTLAAPYTEVVALTLDALADLSPSDLAEVTSGTARRVYRLVPPLHEENP